MAEEKGDYRAEVTHSKVRRHAEMLAKAQGRVRCHVPLPCQQLIRAVWWNFDDVGEPFRRKPDLPQLVGEDFSGVNGCACHGFSAFLWW